MYYAYFDESISTRGEFAVGAFVFSEDDLSPLVNAELVNAGLIPRVDEYKSGARMSGNPTLQALRKSLQDMVVTHRCRLGVSITPDNPRNHIGESALEALDKIIRENGLMSENVVANFDQGLFTTTQQKRTAAYPALTNCEIRFEQDSRIIGGIQVADLVAFMCMRMLEGELLPQQKLVDVRPHPAGWIPLDYSFWGSLRYLFFSRAVWDGGYEDIETVEEKIAAATVDVASCGLQVSLHCSETLRAAAFRRFGSMYLGCTA